MRKRKERIVLPLFLDSSKERLRNSPIFVSPSEADSIPLTARQCAKDLESIQYLTIDATHYSCVKSLNWKVRTNEIMMPKVELLPTHVKHC